MYCVYLDKNTWYWILCHVTGMWMLCHVTVMWILCHLTVMWILCHMTTITGILLQCGHIIIIYIIPMLVNYVTWQPIILKWFVQSHPPPHHINESSRGHTLRISKQMWLDTSTSTVHGSFPQEHKISMCQCLGEILHIAETRNHYYRQNSMTTTTTMVKQ